MGRPIRNTDPSIIRHVSSRTLNAQLLMRPNPQINEIIGGVIAKYQQKHKIILYAVSILSNHYHLVAQAPEQNLWEFEQSINREIAKRINWYLGRKGYFWHRRYGEEATLTDEDALQAVLYVTCNPVNHGLVEHPRYWPGVSPYKSLVWGKRQWFKFTNYTDYGKAKARYRNAKIIDFKEDYELVISPLPQFEKMGTEERQKLISKYIEERVEEIHEVRSQNEQGFLGRKKVLRQNPFSFPREVKCSPRPKCYTRCLEAKKVFLEWHYAFIEAFRIASKRFRSGEYNVKFPDYCLKPPCHYVPV